MLVRVKVPLTERQAIRDSVTAMLQSRGVEFEITDDDEGDDDDLLNVEDTEWFQTVAPTVTPGKSLRIYRANAKMTLALLAEASGIAKSHLSAMEHDKRAIGKTTAQKLARALDIDYRSLL